MGAENQNVPVEEEVRVGEAEISSSEQEKLTDNLAELGENLNKLKEATEGKKLSPEFEAALKTLKDFWERNGSTFELIALLTVGGTIGDVVFRNAPVNELISGLEWFAEASLFAGTFAMPRVFKELKNNLKGLKPQESII